MFKIIVKITAEEQFETGSVCVKSLGELNMKCAIFLFKKHLNGKKNLSLIQYEPPLVGTWYPDGAVIF